MKRYQIVLYGIVAAALLFVACDLLPINDWQPSGSTFNLNSNIELLSVTGDPGFSTKGPVTLAMNIKSRTSGSESANLPAGLTFLRRSNSLQYTVLLKSHSVTAQPAGSKAVLGAFCCNKNRPSPDQGDTFDLGPVTDDSGLQEIIDLIASKNISGPDDMFIVQHAVYMVTDSTGLNQAYRDSLAALPPEQ